MGSGMGLRLKGAFQNTHGGKSKAMPATAAYGGNGGRPETNGGMDGPGRAPYVTWVCPYKWPENQWVDNWADFTPKPLEFFHLVRPLVGLPYKYPDP